MSPSDIVRGLKMRADDAAAVAGIPPEHRTAFVVGWLEMELEEALAALQRTKHPEAKEHLKQLRRRAAAPPWLKLEP